MIETHFLQVGNMFGLITIANNNRENSKLSFHQTTSKYCKYGNQKDDLQYFYVRRKSLQKVLEDLVSCLEKPN